MKTIISRLFMVPVGLLLLVLTGCGSGDGQGTSIAGGGSQQIALTAEDIATTKAIENSVASLDNNGTDAVEKSATQLAPVAGELKVYGKNIFVVPKSGTISFTKTFNGIVDGAQGTLVFYNSFGKDIPTTPCTGTAKQIKVCQAARSIALAFNPTSVQVDLNGQTVIAPNQIPRTQGKALIPVTVNKLNNMLQITLSGPAYSFIQLEVWSLPTAPVPASPTANFTFDPTSGTIPLGVKFDASSSSSPNGIIINYAWDFGDGVTESSSKNATDHAYRVAGTFAITLTVTDSAGKSATKTSSIVVSSPPPPVASFTYAIDTSTGVPILNVYGSSSSAPRGALLVSYTWSWGDFSPDGSGATANHTYTAPGIYNVVLTVTDSFGATASTAQLITIPAGPFANFTLSPSGGTAPVDILFDASLSNSLSGAIINYNWDFGDGTSAVGVDQFNQVFHSYIAPGTYTATLTVTDAAGNNATKSVSVVATTPLAVTAAFTHTITIDPNIAGTVVLFNASSSFTSNGIILGGVFMNGPVISYLWDFGDGAGPAIGGMYYENIYSAPGTYNVTLTVTDYIGVSGTTTQAITIP